MPEDELRHVGVIGMKWGVRRAQRQSNKAEQVSRNLKALGLTTLSKNAHQKALSERAKATELHEKVKVKERERFQKNLEIARKKSKSVNDLIDSCIQNDKQIVESRGKKYDLAANKKFWNDVFKGETTVKDIKKNRDKRTRAQNKVEDVLVMVGDILVG